MKKSYAKVIVAGSPITKSNFKLFNESGRAILPYNSGKYHDRYALYEEEISYCARLQNPGIVIDEALIAVLKVYYKSEKGIQIQIILLKVSLMGSRKAA